MTPIRLLLVDDHLVVRAGLRSLLERYPHVRVIGEAESVATAIMEAGRLRPDIIVMDIQLGDGSGLDACRRIKALTPECRILILTSFTDDSLIFEAIGAGVDGYLLKRIDVSPLLAAIEQIAAGESVLDPAVTKRVMGLARNPKTGASKLELLTPQERCIMEHVSEGKTNKEIAMAMGLSDKTVKNYLRNAFEKLQLKRRAQAAVFFVQHSHG